jgi:antitoxin VapB
MDTAKLFQSGRNQAVRLPKDYRLNGSEVAVKHFGNGVLLLPLKDPWQTLKAGLAAIARLTSITTSACLIFFTFFTVLLMAK